MRGTFIPNVAPYLFGSSSSGTGALHPGTKQKQWPTSYSKPSANCTVSHGGWIHPTSRTGCPVPELGRCHFGDHHIHSRYVTHSCVSKSDTSFVFKIQSVSTFLNAVLRIFWPLQWHLDTNKMYYIKNHTLAHLMFCFFFIGHHRKHRRSSVWMCIISQAKSEFYQRDIFLEILSVPHFIEDIYSWLKSTDNPIELHSLSLRIVSSWE